MSERDPRVDPRPGDVLSKEEQVFKVTLAGRQIHFEVTTPNHPSPIYRMPMMCKLSLKRWREQMRKADA